MRFSRFTASYLRGVLALGALCLVAEKVHAVVAPSTWTTDIQVQGEAEGTEFDDWAASGIPIAITDDADNAPLVDINTVKIANDDDFIYLHVTYHGYLSVGTLLAFDTDQDPNTGFNVFDLGEIGSELGFLNDFPFEQAPGVFDTEDPLTGGPVGDPPGNGGADAPKSVILNHIQQLQPLWEANKNVIRRASIALAPMQSMKWNNCTPTTSISIIIPMLSRDGSMMATLTRSASV